MRPLASRAYRARSVVRELRRFPVNQFVHRNEIAAFVQADPGTVCESATMLVKQGWLESRKGPGGGYRLSAEARQFLRTTTLAP